MFRIKPIIKREVAEGGPLRNVGVTALTYEITVFWLLKFHTPPVYFVGCELWDKKLP